jgi:hypothetical protein
VRLNPPPASGRGPITITGSPSDVTRVPGAFVAADQKSSIMPRFCHDVPPSSDR